MKCRRRWEDVSDQDTAGELGNNAEKHLHTMIISDRRQATDITKENPAEGKTRHLYTLAIIYAVSQSVADMTGADLGDRHTKNLESVGCQSIANRATPDIIQAPKENVMSLLRRARILESWYLREAILVQSAHNYVWLFPVVCVLF